MMMAEMGLAVLEQEPAQESVARLLRARVTRKGISMFPARQA